MLASIVFFSLFSLQYASAASTFDQSQTGNLNVQVDLKDLQIIALMKAGKEEYVDYDYAYDYSEMTIKPQNGTTPKPLNVTSTSSNSSLASDIADNTTSNPTTVALDSSSLAIRNATDNATESFPSPTSETVSMTSDVTNEEIQQIVVKNSTSTPAPGCKKGFVMNKKGDCELKLQSTGNALLKLVKLSQRLKLRRENRRGQPTSGPN